MMNVWQRFVFQHTATVATYATNFAELKVKVECLMIKEFGVFSRAEIQAKFKLENPRKIFGGGGKTKGGAVRWLRPCWLLEL